MHAGANGSTGTGGNVQRWNVYGISFWIWRKNISDNHDLRSQIASIEQTNQDTPEFFDPAWSMIYSQIMANQSADGIDTVSGATYSSEGILDAAQKALAQAKN